MCTDNPLVSQNPLWQITIGVKMKKKMFTWPPLKSVEYDERYYFYFQSFPYCFFLFYALFVKVKSIETRDICTKYILYWSKYFVLIFTFFFWRTLADYDRIGVRAVPGTSRPQRGPIMYLGITRVILLLIPHCM